LFVLLAVEKNEQRSAAAVIGPFGSSPDKGGYFSRAFISFSTPSVFLTPSPYGHSPYMAVPHRGRGLKSSLSPYAVL